VRTHPTPAAALCRRLERLADTDGLRVGVDVDGVLAHFNHGFLAVLTEVAGPPVRPIRQSWMPDTWHWPPTLGYDPEVIETAWRRVAASPDFWRGLPALPGASACLAALSRLARGRAGRQADVYFLTRRLGETAKAQTEQWLIDHGYHDTPTVLVTPGSKGWVARALALSVLIDDYPDNLVQTIHSSPETLIVLKLAPYNRAAVPDLARAGGHRFLAIHGLEPLTEALVNLCASSRRAPRGTATTTSSTSKAS